MKKKRCRKITLTLPEHRPHSLNEIWSSPHWTKRKAIKDECALILRAAVDPEEAFLFSCKVRLEFRAYLKGRMLDWSNVLIKPYEDALIGLYLKDDNPKHVVGGSITVYRDNKNPRLEIDIVPVS